MDTDPRCKAPFQPDGVEDMSWFAANMCYYILFCYAFCEATSLLLNTYLPAYREHTWRNKRNMDTYVLEVFASTVALIMCCGWGMKVIVKKFDINDIIVARAGLCIMAALYLFEISYRIRMNWQLLLHHLLSILLSILTLDATVNTGDIRLMAAGTLMGFCAITEQPSFVGLFLYRIKSKHASFVLKLSAVNSLVFKMMAVGGSYYVFIEALFFENKSFFPGQSWFTALKVIIFILIPTLIGTQIYGASILWLLGNRCAHAKFHSEVKSSQSSVSSRANSVSINVNDESSPEQPENTTELESR